MSIRIHRRRGAGWTQIANEVLRDPSLSLKAKGLLGQLISHEDGWQLSLKYAETECSDGRYAIRSAITELEEAGYVRREPTKGADGLFLGWDFHVFDYPKYAGTASADISTVRKSVSPVVGKSDNQTRKKNPLDEEPQELEEPQRLSAESDFDRFWKAYPKKTKKAGAERKFDVARRHAHVEALIEGAQRYRDDPNREAAFTMDPTTWLNNGCWDDPPLPSRPRRDERGQWGRAAELAAEAMQEGEGINGQGSSEDDARAHHRQLPESATLA